MNETRSIIFPYDANYKTTDDKSDVYQQKIRVIIVHTHM